MTKGVRMTTGVEFADRDAAPDGRQVDLCEPRAREIFPLAGRVDEKPWMGRRPAMPDMRPVIGEAPRHAGLWFAFGHAHHGFTLGPVTVPAARRTDDRRGALRRPRALRAEPFRLIRQPMVRSITSNQFSQAMRRISASP